MRVPIARTPRTRPTAVNEGYAEVGRPTDFSPVTDPIREFAKNLELEREKVDEFDLNNRLIQETNELQSDFQTRQQTAPLGAANFTDTVLGDYEERHAKLLEEYWEKGYSDEALRRFSLRLGGLRQNFGERALGFQAESVVKLADKEISTLGTRLSQFATANPDGYQSAKEELRQNIWNFPGLEEAQREALFEREMAVVRQGAAKAIAQQNPGLVIDALDPQGFTAPVKAATATGGAYENVRGYQSVATNVASALGLDPEEVAAVMSFESAGTFDPNKMGGDGGNYMGLIQFGPEERRTYGIDKNSTPEEWTNAILGFMRDRGFTPGMGLEDFYSTILTGRPGRYDAKDSNGTSVRNAIPRILADHKEKAAEWLQAGMVTVDPGPSEAPQRPLPGQPPRPKVQGTLPTEIQQQVSNEDGTTSTVRTISIGTDEGEVLIPTVVNGQVVSDEEAIAHYEQTGEHFGVFSTSEEATEYAEWLHKKHEGTLNDFDPSVAQTGNPILDDLNGAERLQVLGWAREMANRQDASLKASMDVTIQNAAASISTGEYAGPMLTREQVIDVYGPVEGEQKWAQFDRSIKAGQVVQRIKTMNPAEIQRELARLEPNPAAETYAQDLSIYQAAQRAASEVQSARAEDPAAYVFQAFPEIQQALNNADTPQQRKAAFAQMERAFERLGVPERDRYYFTEDMLEEAGNAYRSASAPERLNIIESYLDEMGPRAGRTLGKAGGREVARDMVLYAMLRGSVSNYRGVFTDVLRGKEIIEKDPARRPSPQALNGQFRADISTAINNLNPDVSATINEAAAALYVLRGGTTEAGGTVSDEDKYRSALREVLGGTSNPRTGVVDLTRGRVTDWTILPNGVSQTQFENWVEQLQPGDLTRLSPSRQPPVDRTGRPVSIEDIIDEGVFVMVAPGQYGIKMGSDDKWLGTANGGKFLINLRLRKAK